jgi:peptide/nickel transport system substrate-binding protein
MAFVIPVLPERRFAGETFLKSRENRAPFSNGPYRLARWKSQQAIELERNPRYWGKRPHFDRILFRILPENPASYRILVAGDLDESWIDTGLKERAERDPDFQACCRTVEYYDLGYNYIALNNSSPLFSDARVRRAMTMLLDRASMVRNLYHGSARIISGPWAPDSPAYDPRVTPLPFDPPRAATLLTEAGFRDADGDGVRERAGRPFEFEILVSAGTTVGRQIDEIFAAELSRVGVRATVRTLEWASFIERVDSGRYEAASLAWSAADPNPDPYYYWHSSQAAPRGLNSVFYRSPEADRLMEEARREREEGRRRELYHRLHRLLRDDSPVVFVVNASQKYAFRKRVRGLVSSPLGFFGFWPGPLSWWGDPSDATPARGAGGLP